MAFSNGYNYRVRIKIDNAKLGAENATLSNIPLWISLQNPRYRLAENGGALLGTSFRDIRFEDGVGNKLFHQIVDYDGASTGRIGAWVKKTLYYYTGTGANYIYMYYGNANLTATEESPSNTFLSYWDVCHFDTYGTGSFLDTVMGEDLTVTAGYASPATVTGLMGTAASYNNGVSNQFLKQAGGGGAPQLGMTFSLYATFGTLPASGATHFLFGVLSSYALRLDNVAGVYKLNFVKYGVVDQYVNFPSVQANVRYKIDVVQGTTDVKYYVNGALLGSFANSQAFITNANERRIGGNEQGSSVWNKTIIEEFRVRPSVVTEKWILTEYNNQTSPSTFYSVSREEAGVKYWVGNGGNFNEESHWATTSGGAGGAATPDYDENVFFDANSFTLPAQVVNGNHFAIWNMDWTGVTNNPTFNLDADFDIYGTLLRFSPNMQVTSANTAYCIDLYTYSSDMTLELDSGGIELPRIMSAPWGSSNMGLTLLSDITCYELNVQDNAPLTFNTNNHNITCTGPDGYCGSTVVTNNYGTSTITAATIDFDFSGNGTIAPSTQNVACVLTGGGYYYADSGQTVGSLTVLGNSDYNIDANNSILDLVIKAGVTFALDNYGVTPSTISVGNFTAFGTQSLPIVLTSLTAGKVFTLSSASGKISATHLNFKDMAVTGGAQWIAYNSINSGNSTGWTMKDSRQFMSFF